MLENIGKGNYAEYGAFNREIKLLSPASVDQCRCSSLHLSRCINCLHWDSFISSSWRHITQGHLCPRLNDFQHVFSCSSSSPQILLDASSIQLGGLPLGVYAPSPAQPAQEHGVYEVCVCPSGKVYLSPAESASTCQAMSNICLWS